jgi:hypothetical protein
METTRSPCVCTLELEACPVKLRPGNVLVYPLHVRCVGVLFKGKADSDFSRDLGDSVSSKCSAPSNLRPA